jgi:hypothetical protein
MKPIALVIAVVVATLAPASARAQSSDHGGPVPQLAGVTRSGYFDLTPGLTQDEFREFAAELGAILRFRPLGDTRPIGKGRIDISVQSASRRIDDAKAADRYVTNSLSSPRIVGRFGLSDRVDLGAWGGYDPHANYGLVGGDVKIALVQQGPGRPVSVSIRPSVTSLVGPSEVWAGTAGLDVSVSRAVGVWAPYAGVGTTGSVAMERSDDVALDPAFADGSVAYAGLAYRWRALLLSAEVEKARVVSYAFRVGSRF